MKNIILFDNDFRAQLLPLTFTRPIAELRIGILTIREKWEQSLNGKVSYMTQDYLSQKFPIHIEEENYVINGAVLPSPELCKLINQLDNDEVLLAAGEFIATKLGKHQFHHLMNNEDLDALLGTDIDGTPFLKIKHTWDLFKMNASAIQWDFDLLTKNRKSAPLSSTNTLIGENRVFLEEGAKVEGAILNTTNGPIYVGKNAEIMEGCLVRGSFSLGDHSILKMGAKIYGATTIGPYCKVGGEVKNSVLLGYSNKSHDGYLGNAVLGEWCNLGANTNNSNMKNNYSNVKVWSYEKKAFVDSRQQFCGLIMGDHSKCSINTMFNTGTVVGVFANIFGAGFPDKFIPSFSWNAINTFSTYRLEKALEVMEKVFYRRNKVPDELEKNLLKSIFEQTSKFRKWEIAVASATEKNEVGKRNGDVETPIMNS